MIFRLRDLPADFARRRHYFEDRTPTQLLLLLKICELLS